MKKAAAAAAALAVAASCLTASAANEIYVNESTLNSGLEDAYALGAAGDAQQLGRNTAYAITKNGIELVETPEEPVGGGDDNKPVDPGLETVNVGLTYGNNALAAANLENSVGSGYVFGFYDSNKDFFEVGRTDETAITVVKDTNVSVDAGTVGCYHIRMPGEYSDFNQASNAAAASPYPDAFVSYNSGTYYVLVGHYESSQAAQSAAAVRSISGDAYSGSNRCVAVTKTGTTDIIFEFDYGELFSLAARPVSTGAKAETWHKGNTYYGDFQFLRLNGGDITVSNFLSLEDYIKGVVPYEMSSSWPLEALKAQALCARTYAASNETKHRSQGFDICSTVDCQAYLGTKSATDVTDESVESTSNQYISYGGQLCSTLYSSSDGGATEDSENVFMTALPYLRGKKDPYEASIDFPNKSWTASYSNAEIGAKLAARGYSLSQIVSIEPTYTNVGNMNKLTFTDKDGKQVTITKDQCRTVMGLNSIHYTLTKRADNPNQYDIVGGGWGHNVGMSQWGAYSMAKVHNKTANDIIQFYYTGVAIG